MPLAVVAITLALTACDQIQLGTPAPPAPPPPPQIAVVDVDGVAAAIGADQVLKEQLENAGQQMTGQLTEFAQKMRDQIDAEQAKLTAESTVEERNRLVQMATEAQRRVRQGQQEARQKAVQLRQSLINKFREQIAPHAERIARERGASVVVTSNTALWYSPEDDITDLVIAAMRESTSAAPAAPAESTGTTN